MKRYEFKKILSRSLKISVAALFGGIIMLNVFPAAGGGMVHASANELGFRSLTVTSSADGNTDTNIGGTPENPGQGGNGQKTGETFQFTLPTGTNVGTIALIYCDSPLPGTTCNTPTGMTTANINTSPTVTINGSSPGNAISLDTTTTNQSFDTAAGLGTAGSGSGCNGTGGSATRVNCLLLKTSTANAQSANDVDKIVFTATATNYITNPTNDNYTFFVRIMLFSDTGYSTAVDTGTVASATTQQVNVTAKVQETLNFSVTAGAPNAPTGSCTALPNGTTGLNLGDVNGVLSATTAYTAHSYFRLSTNALNGVSIQYSGDTLHSGTNTIAAISNAGASSSPGSAQFGVGIDSTDTQSGDGYSFTQLAATAPYNSINTALGVPTNAANKWAYDTTSVNTPVQIANSSSIVVCDTGSVSYLGNIAYSTPAGIYTTAVTYLAVPEY